LTRPLILALMLTVQVAGATPVGHWSVANVPDISAVIDQAIAPMNFLFRPIARSRLRKTNLVYQHILVSRTASEFIVQFDDRPVMRMPADGTPVTWTRDDGEKLTLAAHQAGEDLEQTFTAGDGQRTNVFHVDPGARLLRLQVTVSSPRLPGPVAYTIDYQPSAD
jgi:hypothetical protein